MSTFRERAEQPRRPFPAPLIAGAVAVLAVLGVLIFNALRPAPALTIEGLTAPVVAAEFGGHEVFPPNSLEAFTEDAKFGYLPAPALARLADGTVVAADETGFDAIPGIPGPLSELSAEQFAQVEIPSPREGQPTGSTTTWEGLLDELGGATVYIARIEDPELLADAADAVTARELQDSVIVRSADPEVLAAASSLGLASMAEGAAASEAETSDVLLSAEAGDEEVRELADAGTRVWIDAPADEAALRAAAEAGAFGAVAANPFEVLPQETR